jgi:hypothetical protein
MPDDNIVRLAELQDRAPWLSQCVLGDNGRPIANLANALLATHAVMPDAFAFDEMLRAPLLMRPLETGRIACRGRSRMPMSALCKIGCSTWG